MGERGDAAKRAIIGERLPIRDRLKLRQVHDFSARLRSPVSLGPGAGVKSRETPPANRPGRSMSMPGEISREVMEPQLKNIFVGVSTFAVGLLYFYALALSVVVALTNTVPWYLILGAWVIISIVLFYAKDRSAKGESAQSS